MRMCNDHCNFGVWRFSFKFINISQKNDYLHTPLPNNDPSVIGLRYQEFNLDLVLS
jgi:hypothetical protein